MSVDPMAAAIDWLDTYRASDLEAMLNLFAEQAVIECRCCTMLTVQGKESFEAFWLERFRDCVPLDLDDLQPSGGGTAISYVTRSGTVDADIHFN